MNLIVNSNWTNQRLRTSAKCVWIPALICAIFAGTTHAQQKPLRHFVPPNQIIKRIPISQSKTDYNPISVARLSETVPEPIRTDRMVFKANHENDNFAGTPNRDSNTNRQPIEQDLPWTYKLKHLSYDEFQSKLADIWGDRLMGTALDDDQRFIRVFFPESKIAPETSMKFDRIEGKLTYEGSPNRKAGWHELMNALDRSQHPNQRIAVEVIDIGNADQRLVKQVSAYLQDDETDSLQLPEGVSTEELFGAEDLPVLTGQIRVSINEETGLIILDGPKEDIAKLKEFIEKFLQQKDLVGTRRSERIQLFNSDPDDLQEKVQQSYDEQFADVHGPAQILSAPSSKSLVVVGSESAIEAIDDLVRKLDGKGPIDDTGTPDATGLTEAQKGYRVFRIVHISANEAAAAVNEYFGTSATTNNNAQRQPLPVSTHVEQRSNSLTVFASPPLLARAAALIKELDMPPQEGGRNKRVLKVFPVRNHRAGDFAVILQDALNGGFQQNTGLTESTIQPTNNQNQFQNTQQNQGQPTSSIPQIRIEIDGQLTAPANFFDVRITADNASNRIAVVAPEESMPLIEELIAQLDKIPDLASEVKMFQIINGDANEVLATLEALFTGSQQGGQGNQTASLSDLPLQSPGTDGSSLLNVRFAVAERTNTIIASGSASDLIFVENLIYRLDERDIRDRVTKVFRLSNASVADVNAAINNFLTLRDDINTANPLAAGGPNASGVIAARRSIIVVEEQTSNSLIVNARREMLREIDMIIQKLDRRPTMVRVKAMIVQVDLSQLENFGIDFGIQDSSIFEAGLSDSIGLGFNALDNAAGQLVSNLGVARGAGLVLSAGNESLDVILNTLKQKGCAEVLFAPQLTTMENLEGRFNQGASIQRSTGFNQGVGGILTQNFTDVQTGITLAITPRVSPDGMIVMFVDVTNSALGAASDGVVIGVDQFGNPIESRPINQTTAQTTIMSRSGQTVVISGLMQEQKSQNISSIPILGDLPVIGPLFQNVQNSAERSELLIILTPYIVDGEDDISAMNEDSFNRMHWCECDVAELYGDTSYTGSPYREQSPVVIYPDEDPLGNQPDFDSGNGQYGMSSNEPEPVFPTEQSWRGREQGSGTRMMNEGFNSNSDQYETLPPSSRYQSPQGRPIRSAREYYDRPDHRRPTSTSQRPSDQSSYQHANSRRPINSFSRQTDPRNDYVDSYHRREQRQDLFDNQFAQSNNLQPNDRQRSNQYTQQSFGDRPRSNDSIHQNQSMQSNQPLELNSSSSGARFRLH